MTDDEALESAACFRWPASSPRALGQARLPRAAPLGQRRGAGRRRQACRGPARSRSPTAACCSSNELPEFDRHVLDVLREPLESGRITISRRRAAGRLPGVLPAGRGDEPVPLRLLGHRSHACSCTPALIARYQERISGPLLDRIDLRVRSAVARRAGPARLAGRRAFALVRQRVLLGNERARVRQGCTNANADRCRRRPPVRPAGAVRQLLHSAGSRLGWSARAYHRVLRVARTIADLGGADELSATHVAEAIQYRRSLRDSSTAR